jgi:hypothetical protein
MELDLRHHRRTIAYFPPFLMSDKVLYQTLNIGRRGRARQKGGAAKSARLEVRVRATGLEGKGPERKPFNVSLAECNVAI